MPSIQTTPQCIRDKLAHLPSQPGVYLMKGEKGDILYVGKAQVLSDRVRSYFQKGGEMNPKTRLLVSLVADIEILLTESGLEALILESNLVKRHRPRFNVVLRDDKQYPYLRLPVRDAFPRLSIVRRVKQDGARYFGPYVPAGALRETLKAIRKVFPLATCTIDIDGTATRACLEFEIQRCFAPCTGNQTREEYHQIVHDVCLFLEGRDRELISGLQQNMEEAAGREEFEEAARLRDRIRHIRRTLEKQRVAQIGPVDQDVLGLARLGPAADVQLLFIRGGLLIGRKDFYWTNAGDTSSEELLQSTIEQFYNKDMLPPKELLVSVPLPDTALIQTWLSEKKAASVRVVAPLRGAKHRLVQLAEDNALVALHEHIRRESVEQQAEEDLQRVLALPTVPARIEAFDISNTMGAYSVASMVVWDHGTAKKSDYRRFRIRTVEGADDFASMHEVVRRRYGGSLTASRTKGLPLPDLIVIDGGLGQVHAAQNALLELGLGHLSIVGLAKARHDKEERIFFPHRQDPLALTPKTPSTRLLQRIRDEAHRFAITYHRKLRGQALVHPERHSRPSSSKPRASAGRSSSRH